MNAGPFETVFEGYELFFGDGFGPELLTWDGFKRPNQRHYIYEIIERESK